MPPAQRPRPAARYTCRLSHRVSACLRSNVAEVTVKHADFVREMQKFSELNDFQLQKAGEVYKEVRRA